MRIPFFTLIAISAALAGGAKAAEIPLEDRPYPGVIALSETTPGKWTYRSFPSLLPLYTFNGEPPDLSTCDKVCIQVWPIIRATASDKPTGDWTIVKRDDGLFQWAYKGKPVYTYFEDEVNAPHGGGKLMYWYLGEAGIEYLKKAGVTMLLDAPAAERKKTGPEEIAAPLDP